MLLIQEYGDLDTLLARASEIKQPKRREALEANADLVRISRQLVTLKDDTPLETGLEFESNAFGMAFSTDDMREGTRAFLERRKPAFQGR